MTVTVESHGQDDDLVLLVPFAHLPESTIVKLKARVSNKSLTLHVANDANSIADDILQRVTVLVTLTYLPDPSKVPKLKLIHALSSGVDHLLSHALVKGPSVRLTSSCGIHGPPIAEWVVMNWLVASRKFKVLAQAQISQTWDQVDGYLHHTEDQVGKHVGILGYGSIGRQIARQAVALGMTVHAYTATPKTTTQSRQQNGYIIPGTGDPYGELPTSWHHGTSRDTLRLFLSIGLDHLVVAVPLTGETTRLLGENEIQTLSSHCKNGHKPFIVNISRGKVFDQDALIESLRSGELSGAALDMTDPHPLPQGHPLWDVPNVQLTPHISAMGQAYFPRSFDILTLNLERMKDGLPLINQACITKGY